MKRLGNLYQKIFDIENLKKAHYYASYAKGWYKEVKDTKEYIIKK